MRADDPAAAAAASPGARARAGGERGRDAADADARREISTDCGAPGFCPAMRRAARRIARARAGDATPANVLDYALLLLAAQQDQAAIAQLESLARPMRSPPVALRLIGLVEFQEDELDAAAQRFTELADRREFVDDSFYYLGLDCGAACGSREGAAPLCAGAKRRQCGRGALAREQHFAGARRRAGRAGAARSSDRG